jgi:hypothetical protein
VKSVVKGFSVKKDAEAIGLPDLSPLLHLPVVLAEDLLPVRDIVWKT